MSSQRPDVGVTVAPTCNRSTSLPVGFPAIYAGRLAPLALDNAKRRIDPMLFSVTVGGLRQKQIDEVDLTSIFSMKRIRSAIRAVSSRLR